MLTRGAKQRPLAKVAAYCLFFLYQTLSANCADHPPLMNEGPFKTWQRTQMAQIYLELSRHVSSTDLDNSLILINKALYQSNDSSVLRRATRIKGLILNAQGKSEEAFLTLVPLYYELNKMTVEERISVLNVLGLLYLMRGDFGRSITAYYEALAAAETIKSVKWKLLLMHNIGLYNYKIKNYSSALEMFRQCLPSAVTLDSASRAVLYSNVSLCHSFLGNPSEAIGFAKVAISFLPDSSPIAKRCEIIYSLATANYFYGSFEGSKILSQECVKLAQEAKYSRFVAEGLILLIRSLLKEDVVPTYNVAPLIQQTVKICEENNLPQVLLEAHKVSIEYYTQQNDSKKLSEAQQLYIKHKDSLYSTTLAEDLASVHALHRRKQYEKVIQHQKSALDSKKRSFRLQTLINYLVGAIAIVSLYIFYLLARAIALNSKINGMLTRRIKERQMASSEANRSLAVMRNSLADLIETRIDQGRPFDNQRIENFD